MYQAGKKCRKVWLRVSGPNKFNERVWLIDVFFYTLEIETKS